MFNDYRKSYEVWPCDMNQIEGLRQGLRLVPTAQELICPEDHFVVEFARTGLRHMAVRTGRTRNFRGCVCPTLNLFEIDTTVIDGALWGTKGKRIPGTWAAWPGSFD